MKRYTSELKRLIERYGADTSLQGALDRESNPKPGAPRVSINSIEECYMLVELAVQAGYQLRPACRLFDDFFRINLGEDWVRNRYYSGQRRFKPTMRKHRTAILEWHAQKFSDWTKHIRAVSGAKSIG
jgi:hypothetical protein